MPRQYSWHLLRAGSFRLDGGGMFGVIPKTIWSKLTAPDDQNRIALQTNCLLLDDHPGSPSGTRILIETGFGDKWSDKERGYYDLQHRTVADAIRETGIAPEQIDHVIVTHLHFDHAAGLTTPGPAPGQTSGEPIPVFPNARIHIQRTEWEDALANKSTMSRTYLRSHLDPIAHQVVLHDGDAEIFPGAGIHVEPMPGHTWGQQAVRFADERGTIIFPGDVIPTVNHIHPAFSLGYDMEPYTNMLTKQRLLKRAAAEGLRLVLDHEPGHAVVRVEPDPAHSDRHRLVAVDQGS